MDCARIHERLDAWLAGELGAAESAGLEAHLQECAECRGVVEFATSDAPELEDALVLRPVQAATSGRSCDRVLEVLATRPAQDDPELRRARAHLPGCAACSRHAAVLEELDTVLPELRSIDPGPDFTAAVLLTTLPRPSLASVFWRRVRDHLERWQRRPEFAQELSFALTVALVLVTVLPGSPLQDVPRQALSLVRVAPAEAAAPGAVDEGTVGVQLRQELRARSERVGTGLDRLGTHVLGAGRGLVDGDLGEMGENAGQIGCDLRRLWVGVKAPSVDPESICR